jgi:hypothetical protein
MNAIRLTALIGALSLASVLTTPAGAEASALSASLYPRGAVITYRPDVSNHTMDCLWGFLCEGDVSLYHSRLQDDLHRLGGWAQFAGLHRHSRLSMAFELFASRYAPDPTDQNVPWAGAALTDFGRALQAHSYTMMSSPPRLLGRDSIGAQTVERSGKDMVVMAAWSGHTEVEAIVAFYQASSTARRAAIGMPAQQVRRALSVATS